MNNTDFIKAIDGIDDELLERSERASCKTVSLNAG